MSMVNLDIVNSLILRINPMTIQKFQKSVRGHCERT